MLALWTCDTINFQGNMICMLNLQLYVQSVSCEFDSRTRGSVFDAILHDQVCQLLAICLWFSPGTPISPTSKIERHGIAEILLKVVLNAITKYSILERG